MMLRPLYLQSNSDVARKALFPFGRTAFAGRHYALPAGGPTVASPISSSPDFLIFSDAEGLGRCAALLFSPRSAFKRA